MACLSEIQGNLFHADGIRGYAIPQIPIVHCVSADFEMGAGFALQIERRYHIKSTLRSHCSNQYPAAYMTKNIINLVTKGRYFEKPTYGTLQQSLKVAEWICRENKINHVVMPTIGSGLDKLDWGTCKDYILAELVENGISVDVYVYR